MGNQRERERESARVMGKRPTTDDTADPTPKRQRMDAVKVEERRKQEQDAAKDKEPGRPHAMRWTSQLYRAELLKRHKKPLYKDPPAVPPRAIVIDVDQVDPPRRTKEGFFIFKDAPGFQPNKSPSEILRMGAFGGTYWRNIDSTVTQTKYKGSEVIQEFPKEWFKGLSHRQMHSQSYNKDVNFYKVKCGADLNTWESSGWISDADPYGWFHWYCRFFQGRRCSDDERQLSRAAKCFGKTGRWRVNLFNKILKANAKVDDARVSPVVRQTLLHWGYVPTEAHLSQYAAAKEKKQK